MRLITLLIAMCCFLADLPAQGSDISDAAAVRSAYVTLQNALFKNDRAALAAILAPDFRQVNANGTVDTRDTYLEEATETAPGLAITVRKLIVTSLEVHGNTARANATYSLAGTYSAGNVSKPYRGVMRVTDDWTRIAGTWNLRTITIDDLVSYIDGKKVQEEHAQVAPSKAAIGELRTRAVVIPTLAFDADPDQLAAIGAAIGDARIVGMGEGSHGSSEFFAFKNRLFKYLVEKKGFTVFAMEADWSAGLAVDQYIKTGRGTAQQAVASLGFWTWDTPEVVELVQWMRDYNAALGKHATLTFVGVDMQDPIGAVSDLERYLRNQDPAALVAAQRALQCSVNSVADFRVKPTSDCREQVAALSQRLTSIKNVPDAFTAQQAVTNITQSLDWRSAPAYAMPQMRDEAMARNLEWAAARYADAKIALWAHNGHVDTIQELSYRSMGSYLREAFGTKYYAIGQTFGSGTVRAGVKGKGLQSVSVPLNHSDTLVELFCPLKSAAFIDLRGLLAGSALQSFFSTQHNVEEIGSTIDPTRVYEQNLDAVLPRAFDGLVYIPTSTATVAVRTRPQAQRVVHKDGTHWITFGAGLDDITISATSTEATFTDHDGLDATQHFLLRRFDATPYTSQAVRLSGEARSDDFYGIVLPVAEAKTRDGLVVASSGGSAIGRTGDGAWIPITLALKVPESASSIEVGFWTMGLGSAEVRDLRVDASRASPSASPTSRDSPTPVLP